ncbi:MAG: hypothetical protein Q7S82_01600 [bacterium]|nr:hypothetical protein [bacterium]
MTGISRILLNGEKRAKQEARESLARGYNVSARLDGNKKIVSQLAKIHLESLDRKVKHGLSLSFEEAFCGMFYTLAATNNDIFSICKDLLPANLQNGFTESRALGQGIAFLQLMAGKESFKGLTSEEVAGIVAATLMDTVIQLDLGEVIDTCGMGADVGFSVNGTRKKTINVSTLSAVILASLGLPVIKHGSYANTSAVGSTEAIELFGARTNYTTEEEIINIWQQNKFCYLDAHLVKTVHDASHLIMMETINHITGPMSPPISPRTKISRIMGVNEKVHPSVIAKAYVLLHQKELQEIGGIAVVCGLNEAGMSINPNSFQQVKKHAVLDEVSPYASVVAMAHQGKFLGTFLLRPSDFGTTINPASILLENERAVLQQANSQALQDGCGCQLDFLAMNAALGLFAHNYLSRPDAVGNDGLNKKYLCECFQECRRAIVSGRAWQTLSHYVELSGGKPSII